MEIPNEWGNNSSDNDLGISRPPSTISEIDRIFANGKIDNLLRKIDQILDSEDVSKALDLILQIEENHPRFKEYREKFMTSSVLEKCSQEVISRLLNSDIYSHNQVITVLQESLIKYLEKEDDFSFLRLTETMHSHQVPEELNTILRKGSLDMVSRFLEGNEIRILPRIQKIFNLTPGELESILFFDRIQDSINTGVRMGKYIHPNNLPEIQKYFWLTIPLVINDLDVVHGFLLHADNGNTDEMEVLESYHNISDDKVESFIEAVKAKKYEHSLHKGIIKDISKYLKKHKKN